ncbi:DUF6039 family protein [Burkholderia ubonensis]|uniref:DUF6039 family protein n=1 Tax=Burkholderia ubonensis TaxID=101571 RepID=UPI002AB3D252|nr:DUF6039 family protein [Burkholderia ubonensis]MDY7792745.1 DUF6039 family protein [Burkholderia ubonensis]
MIPAASCRLPSRNCRTLVDHDKAFQDSYQEDRLPERGGGDCERIFVQGSFREHVIVPRHGFAREAMDELDPRSFLPPARHQIADDAAPARSATNRWPPTTCPPLRGARTRCGNAAVAGDCPRHHKSFNFP